MKWIVNFVRRRRADRELAQEVESHLEEKVADLTEAGMPEQEARQRARREFGNVALYKEISREVWGWVWLETLSQDLRYGVRMLRKNPGFTLVAASALALVLARVRRQEDPNPNPWLLRIEPFVNRALLAADGSEAVRGFFASDPARERTAQIREIVHNGILKLCLRGIGDWILKQL